MWAFRMRPKQGIAVPSGQPKMSSGNHLHMWTLRRNLGGLAEVPNHFLTGMWSSN